MGGHATHAVCTLILDLRGPLRNLKLTVLTKDLVALFALERHVREVVAHHALDLVNELLLQLILDFFLLDIDLWNRFRAHQLVHDPIGEYKIVLVLCEAFLILIISLWLHLCGRLVIHRPHARRRLMLLRVYISWRLHPGSRLAILVLLQVLRRDVAVLVQGWAHAPGRGADATGPPLVAVSLVRTHHVSTYSRSDRSGRVLRPLLLVSLEASVWCRTAELADRRLLLSELLLGPTHVALRNVHHRRRLPGGHLARELVVGALCVNKIWLHLLLVPLVWRLVQGSEGVALWAGPAFHAWPLVLIAQSTVFLHRFSLFLDDWSSVLLLLSAEALATGGSLLLGGVGHHLILFIHI